MHLVLVQAVFMNRVILEEMILYVQVCSFFKREAFIPKLRLIFMPIFSYFSTETHLLILALSIYCSRTRAVCIPAI